MGELLAAVQAFGPSGLFLLLGGSRAGCGLACATLTGCRAAIGSSAIPASAEGSGHALPGSGGAGCRASFGCLRAGLGDVAQARHCAFRTTACGGGAGLERRFRTASRRRGRTRTSAGQLGGSRCHTCASGYGTAYTRRGSTDSYRRPGRTDGSACHRARAELRRTGH
jgi:hypothetical protein